MIAALALALLASTARATAGVSGAADDSALRTAGESGDAALDVLGRVQPRRASSIRASGGASLDARRAAGRLVRVSRPRSTHVEAWQVLAPGRRLEVCPSRARMDTRGNKSPFRFEAVF